MDTLALAHTMRLLELAVLALPVAIVLAPAVLLALLAAVSR